MLGGAVCCVYVVGGLMLTWWVVVWYYCGVYGAIVGMVLMPFSRRGIVFFYLTCPSVILFKENYG